MRKIYCSVSMRCVNLARLEDSLLALEAAGCDELHFDIMDGQFVPDFALGFDTIRAVKTFSGLPCACHLMITQPERYIERFVEAGCNSMTVHLEACRHAHRVLDQIRDTGASPGIALNPATPLTKLEYLLEKVDRVTLLTVDPGEDKQKALAGAYDRVQILRENLSYLESSAKIEVMGDMTVRNAALLANAGAGMFVLDTASIFHENGDLGEALVAFRAAVAQERHLV